MKLEIELAPSTAWRSSLYRLMPKKEWYCLKNKVYAEEGRKCYICGSKLKPLSLHEFWEYDDIKHVQRLSAIHHLCGFCHKIKHIGFWCHTAEGKTKLEQTGIDRDDLINHFCSVNNCTKEDYKKHEHKAFDVWGERSKYQWKQDFGRYEEFVSHENDV